MSLVVSIGYVGGIALSVFVVLLIVALILHRRVQRAEPGRHDAEYFTRLREMPDPPDPETHRCIGGLGWPV